MRKLITVLCASLLALAFNLGGVANAQTLNVHGKVIDDSGEGVIGAGIVVKGTTNGVATDMDGNFELKCSPDDILVVSCVGYDAVEEPVNKRSSITITLNISKELLDDVVVIGYGTTRAKNFTGSVDVVKVSDSPVADMGLPQTSDLIRGRLSGVVLGAETSSVGNNASILVRGKKSIKSTSTSPLLVVNGVIFSGELEDIDQNSIDQISVLKDATSLAAYGSKAANGVIMITTKKGKEGKPTISFSTSQQISRPTYIPEVLSPEEYIVFRNIRNRGLGFEGDIHDPSGFMTYMEKQQYDKGIVTDWYDLAIRTGWTQNYNLNFSGRTANSNYYVSLGHQNQQGTVVGDSQSRNNVSMNLSSNITKNVEVGVNMAYTNTLDDENAATLRYDMFTLSPYGSAYLPDGRLRYYSDGTSGSRINPLWNHYYGGDYEQRYTNFSLGGYLSVNIPWVEGLNYRVNASYTQRNDSSKKFVYENNLPAMLGEMDIEGKGQDPEHYNLGAANGSISTSETVNWVIDNILSYARQFGQHYVSASLVYTRDSKQSSSSSVSGTGFTQAGNTLLGWHGLANADTKEISGPSFSLHTDVGYLARVMYSYKDTYHFNASFRRDGSSVFGADKKWGNFPAFGAAWTISNEKFMKGINWIDMLKLKISWGKNGAQTLSPYGTLSTVALAKDGNMAFYTDGNLNWAQKITKLGNPELGWQTTTSWNGGFEGDFLKGRIHFDINAYYSKTTDQIFSRNIPIMTAGIGTQDATMGQVDNYGLEINASTVNIKKGNFSWESDYVFTLNRNKLRELYGDGKDDVSSSLFIGEPLSVIYTYQVTGIFQDGDDEGLPMYLSVDGENIAHPGAVDKRILGYTDENFRLSWANTLRYKNLSFYFMFQGIFGGGGYGLRDNAYAYQTRSTTEGSALNIPFYYRDRKSNEYPSPLCDDSNYHVYNPYGNVRLQNISLTYNMKSLAQKLGLGGAKVSLSGRNIFVIAPKWRMADPELSNGYTVGMPRAFTLNLNVTF